MLKYFHIEKVIVDISIESLFKQAKTRIKKRTPPKMSFWEVSHNLLNNYFSEHLPVTASDIT